MIAAVLFLAALSTPVPSASPTPPCDRPVMVADAARPGLPQLPAHEVRSVIRVTVNPDGTVARESVESSSGLRTFDQAALMAARQSTYLPKLVNCKAVSGEYLFSVVFSPQ